MDILQGWIRDIETAQKGNKLCLLCLFFFLRFCSSMPWLPHQSQKSNTLLFHQFSSGYSGGCTTFNNRIHGNSVIMMHCYFSPHSHCLWCCYRLLSGWESVRNDQSLKNYKQAGLICYLGIFLRRFSKKWLVITWWFSGFYNCCKAL